MRKYTLLFSIVAHAAIVGALLVAPIVATNALPSLRRSTEFVMVTPQVPRVPPPTLRVAARPRVSPDAAPVIEPERVAPEPPRPGYADPDAEGRSNLPAGVIGGAGADVPDEPAPSPPAPPAPKAPIPVGGRVQPPERLKFVEPHYPAIAQSARVSGMVILQAVIAEDGSVGDVTVLRSIPLLDQAAIDAVRQWQFSPPTLNGKTIPVVMTVTVNFALN
jgi:protein TonB